MRLPGWLLLAFLLPATGNLRAQDLAVKFYDTQSSFGYAIKNSLVEASDHNFYAPASNVIARLTPEGVATAVYRFSDLAADGTNPEGQQPVAGLMVGHDGNLYGLTSKGGANGLGTVYRFIPATNTVQAVASLIAAPQQYGEVNPLVQDRAGNFYYLSFSSTSTSTGSSEVEAIMKVTLDGTVSMLHAFTPPDTDGTNPEGFDPNSGLVIDGQDNLYGFTGSGGSGALGTFYEVTPDGHAVALYNYDPDHNVVDPTPRPPYSRADSIVIAKDGTVYGTASNTPSISGGTNAIAGGAIFKATASQPVMLYQFSDGVGQDDGTFRNAEGIFPGGLTIGSDGTLYGETEGGGANGTGTIFQVTPGGDFKLLYTFPSNAYSFVPPILSSDGDLFGNCYGDQGAYYRLGATLLPVFNAPTLAATVTQNVQFSLQLVAANNPDTYAASGLPTGLSLNPSTGLITGATTAPVGVYSVALSASNSDGSSSATLTITVQAVNPAAPTITVPGTPLSASVGQPFSYQIDASNKPTSYQIMGLPPGVTYDPKTGLIHGLFSNAGKILLQIQAANASGTGVASLEIDVVAAAAIPTVTVVGSNPDANATTGQTGDFTLTLNAATGTDIIVAYTVKGSAVPGTDYQLLKGTVKIKAGKTSKNVKVVPEGDLGGASKKVVKLTLQPGNGYTVGTPNPVKVKILHP